MTLAPEANAHCVLLDSANDFSSLGGQPLLPVHLNHFCRPLLSSPSSEET